MVHNSEPEEGDIGSTDPAIGRIRRSQAAGNRVLGRIAMRTGSMVLNDSLRRSLSWACK